MTSLSILLVSCSLVLSQPSSPGSSSPQPSQQPSTQAAIPPSQQSTSSGWEEAVKLLTISIVWSSLAIQVFVVPFYNKGETLHKDYWGSGKINSTLAAIEAGTLIPSLARMFSLAASQQEDKRRRPEAEMEDLLQSVEFIPDLRTAQNAMSAMDAVRQQYSRLKQLASRLWKVGLFHVLATLLMPTVHVFLIPVDIRFQWLFWISVVGWALSLMLIVWGFFGFHAQIQRFNTLLEINVVQDT